MLRDHSISGGQGVGIAGARVTKKIRENGRDQNLRDRNCAERAVEDDLASTIDDFIGTTAIRQISLRT